MRGSGEVVWVVIQSHLFTQRDMYITQCHLPNLVEIG